MSHTLSLYEIYHACLEDEYWFGELFSKTYCIVFYARHHCHMYEWEIEDLRQEARIILFYTLQHFQTKNIKNQEDFERLFFAYYKRSLVNHFLNLRRYATASKRNMYCNIYSDELDQYYASDMEVEYLALQRVNWHYICKVHLNKEECQLMAYRLKGLSIRQCSTLSHHGTRYTTNQLKYLRKLFK